MPALNEPLLTTLLKQAFPQWLQLSANCWLYQAIDELQNDFGELIEAVTDGGGRPDFAARLRSQHPMTLEHSEQHDKRLLDVFTEGAAFAWAQRVARLGRPTFVSAAGSPDILVGDIWIEAKTIRHSQEEERLHDEVFRPLLDSGSIVMRGPVALGAPPAGLLGKLQSGLDDGVRKWDRQERTGRLVVFYAFRADFGVSPRQTAQELTAWAVRAERQTGAQIVICDGNRWQAPLYCHFLNRK